MNHGIDQSVLYLVEVKLGPYAPWPDCYTLYINDDYPITSNSNLIVFAQRGSAEKALKRSEFGADYKGPIPADVYAVFDFPAALETVRRNDEAESDNLVNCLNTLLDCIRCTKAPMPDEDRSNLVRLADHLTFETSLAKFFTIEQISRQTVAAAIERSLRTIAQRLCVVA
jgi:hypothetical protein